MTSTSPWLIKFSQRVCKYFRRSHRKDRLMYALLLKIWELSDNFCSPRNHKRDWLAAVSEHCMLLSPQSSFQCPLISLLVYIQPHSKNSRQWHFTCSPPSPHFTMLCYVKKFPHIPSFHVFLVFWAWITLQYITLLLITNLANQWIFIFQSSHISTFPNHCSVFTLDTN